MAPSPLNMVHVHGSAIHSEPFARLSGITIHYDMWAENPSPAGFLEAGCAVATGPAPELLASDAPDDDVVKVCAALLDVGGRTILSPGCSVPLAVGADRLRLISAAARPGCRN
jgi:uroporphyrinogen decarboxylase